MKTGETYSILDRKRKALLKRIASTGAFMMATPTYLKSKCGNPGCKCKHDKKARHTSLHLSWTDSEGNGTLYVPVALREEVFRWVKNYWTVKEYMKDMTELSRKMIRIYARSRPKNKKGPQGRHRRSLKKTSRR